MWNVRNIKKLCLVALLALSSLPKTVQAFALYPDYHNNFRFAATNALEQQVFQNAYDPAGNLTNRLDGVSNTITYRYDVINRLIERSSESVQSVQSVDKFSYDPVGNLLTASNETARLAFTYDVMDRLATASTTLNTNHSPLPKN